MGYLRRSIGRKFEWIEKSLFGNCNLKLGMILAGLSMVLSMIPFVCIWFVVRDMLNALVAGDVSLATHSSTYAWWAVGFSVLSILLYFLAHPFPDLMGALVMPVAVLVLPFVFDWRKNHIRWHRHCTH